MVSPRSSRNVLIWMRSSRRAILSYSIAILLFNGVVFFLMYLFSQNDFLEHVDFTPDYDIILTESKTFWRGAWFDRDRLFILRDEFVIEKNSLIGERKTYHIPYGKVKNVTFEECLDIFEIKIDGVSFYVKSRYRYDTIKSFIAFKSINRFKTAETKTFLSIFSH